MTALAAKESGLANPFISGLSADENAVMRELYLRTAVVQHAVAAQERAINLIADRGACVIVGRAAGYVLRGRENPVRVFLYAPRSYRVGKVMEMYGDTEKQGKKSIARGRRPQRLLQKHFRKGVGRRAAVRALYRRLHRGGENGAAALCLYPQRAVTGTTEEAGRAAGGGKPLLRRGSSRVRAAARSGQGGTNMV